MVPFECRGYIVNGARSHKRREQSDSCGPLAIMYFPINYVIFIKNY